MCSRYFHTKLEVRKSWFSFLWLAACDCLHTMCSLQVSVAHLRIKMSYAFPTERCTDLQRPNQLMYKKKLFYGHGLSWKCIMFYWLEGLFTTPR